MIEAASLAFLRDLEANNATAWLHEHRERYDAFRRNMIAIVERLIERSDDYDPAVGKAGLDPRRCMTRLNRDPRIAKGKPPYKSDLYLFVNAGSTVDRVGYYVHIEPGNCFAGASLFIPTPAALKRMRTRIAEDTGEWDCILAAKSFREAFPDGVESLSALKAMPRGFNADHPAAKYLRMKGYGTRAKLTHWQVGAADAFDRVVDAFRAAKPFHDFLNRGA